MADHVNRTGFFGRDGSHNHGVGPHTREPADHISEALDDKHLRLGDSAEMVNVRRRGFDFEREVVNHAKSVSLPAERAYGSNGESLGKEKTVDVVIDGEFCLQCKRIRKINKELAIPRGCHATVFREDNGSSKVLMSLDTLFALLRGDL